jgi:polo-like kinase 1
MLIGKPPFETECVKKTYRKIMAGSYSFPEQVPISKEAKDIVSEILVSEPSLRPSLDELLAHPFMCKYTMPKLLPASTLAVPPSSAYMKKFEAGSRTFRPPRSASQTRISDDLRNPRAEDGRLTERERSTIHRGVSCAESTGSVSCSNFIVGGPKILVNKWVDYSNK